MSATTFTYRAIDVSGSRKRGSIQAKNKQDAYRKLTASGLTLTKLCAAGVRGKARGGVRVSAQEISHFTFQLAVLMEARIPISDGLLSIAEQENNRSFAKMLIEIAGDIQAGSSITGAMKPHARVFGDVYIETMHAAEQSGNMISVLETLAEMLEKESATTKKLQGALTYPIVVLVALFIASTFLITFVVPKFAEMFAQRGVDLPVLTRALQSVGLSVQNYWWAYLLAIAGAVLGLRRMWSSPRGRMILDRTLHRIAFVKLALVGIALSRFSRVFGLCLSSGLGLLESLEMAGNASGRPMLKDDTKLLMDKVRNGERLSDALVECNYIPPFCKRMLIAGEASAELTRMCGVISRHYDREVDHLTKNIATIIEPVLIASMTVVVLIIALAIFMPMWDMASLIG